MGVAVIIGKYAHANCLRPWAVLARALVAICVAGAMHVHPMLPAAVSRCKVVHQQHAVPGDGNVLARRHVQQP